MKLHLNKYSNYLHTNGRQRIGWKLGGTNLETKSKFKSEDIFFGPIYSNKELSQNDLCEVELFVRFNKKIENIDKKFIDRFDFINSFGICLEFPDLSKNINDLDELIQNECCYKSIMILMEDPLIQDNILDNFSIQLKNNYFKIKPIYSYKQIIRKFMVLVMDIGIELKSNEVLALGGESKLMSLNEALYQLGINNEK